VAGVTRMRPNSSGANGVYSSRSWIVTGYGKSVPIADLLSFYVSDQIHKFAELFALFFGIARGNRFFNAR